MLNVVIKIILKYLYFPIIIGGVLGLIIGSSGMRNILLSSNHYISNLVDGIYLITKITIPVMYIPIGISFVS